MIQETGIIPEYIVKLVILTYHFEQKNLWLFHICSMKTAL